MFIVALVLAILLLGALVGLSFRRNRRKSARRALRRERNLEDQRLWEATVAAHTQPADVPSD